MKMKSNQKEIVIVLFTIVNICLYTLLFVLLLNNIYKLDNYSNYVNIAIIFTYLLISFIFGKLFEIFELGETRVYDLFLSYSLNLFITNLFIYFILCILSFKMVSIIPLLLLQIVDELLFAFVLLLENRIIRDKFPIPKAIAIVGEDNNAVLDKIYKYRDILVSVDKKINVRDVNFKKIDDLLSDYEKAVIVDIDYNHKKKIINACYRKNVKVLDIPSIDDMLIASSAIMHIIDTPILKINKFGPSYLERAIKRVIDIIGSLLLIAITSPIMIGIVLAIKIDDGGTIIFKQDRLTINKKIFKIYKFRSMVMNAELFTGAVLAKENDNRITKVGKFIRKTRFDELPQLFNILKGDMTFVGPRPERPEIYSTIVKTLPEFEYRLVVKAGLTGYAQIYGKYNTSLKDKLLLDLYYIENYKLIDDIKLLVQTLKVIFKADSTEGVK